MHTMGFSLVIHEGSRETILKTEAGSALTLEGAEMRIHVIAVI